MRRPEQTLEEILGRLLDPGDRGSVATLNDLPPRLLEEARGLVCGSRLAATEYLRFYVRNTDLSDRFIVEVLEDGTISAAEWGHRDVVCYPNARLSRWATVDGPGLLAPLAHISGERWFRISPELESWHSACDGAPAVVVRSAPYWYEPESSVDFADLSPSPLEPVPDNGLEVALRRWIASRVAWRMRRHLLTHAGENMTEQDICAALGLDAPQLSNDAKLAIGGLLRSGWPGKSDPLVPGFAGPDELYE